MTEEAKRLWDVALSIVTIVGGIVAFYVGLRQWQRGQAWERANKLNDFIEKFETDDLLRFGATALDWTKREVTFRGREVVIKNSDVLLSLRDYRTITERPMYPGEQPIMRDAYDALMTFFQRLELSIATGLIDARHAKAYFGYWLERLVTLDRHPDKDGTILKGVSPEAMIGDYIKMYGDPDSIKRLCDTFGIKHNL
jgi:hypothetical protein